MQNYSSGKKIFEWIVVDVLGNSTDRRLGKACKSTDLEKRQPRGE